MESPAEVVRHRRRPRLEGALAAAVELVVVVKWKLEEDETGRNATAAALSRAAVGEF